MRRREAFGDRRLTGYQTRASLPDRQLQVFGGREKMSASEAGFDQGSYLPNCFIRSVVLRDLARVIPVLKEESSSLLRFDRPDRNFLQMRFGASIIAQSKLYELIRRKASAKFID